MKEIFLFVTALAFFSCGTTNNKIQKEPQVVTANKIEMTTISAPVVKKHFYNKIGEKTEIQEYYVQQSIQDYFIKFCESYITISELDDALDEIDSPIKTLKMEVSILEGEWDSCDGDPVQSRVGKYMIVHKIID